MKNKKSKYVQLIELYNSGKTNVDELKIEVDVFKGVYEGVVFAEIEFKSKEQAAQIELPKWFDKEMSQIITNSKMATQNMKSFIEFEK